MRLMPQVVEAPANLKQDLHTAMQKVWAMYYPIGDQPDVPFCLGMVYTGLERCEEALEFFKHSISLYGPSAPAAYHTGVCHLALGDVEAAIRNVDWALELDPGLESAQRLKAQLVD
jgi:tetratricopeptide (TPR) repeat protein